MRVELLGPLRAFRDAGELVLGPARRRAVFAALALAGRPVAVGELVAAVWGPGAPAGAAGSVHGYISGLRRVLGRDLLTSGPAGYELAPVRLDATVFERLIHRARDEPGERVAWLDKALGMWHGEPLAGVPGPFAETERARLVDLRLTAAELRAETRMDDGEAHGLPAELAALVREFPLRERLRELMMLALYQCGRRADALAAFRDARTTLAEELGAEPGIALRRLYEGILANDVVLKRAKTRLDVLPSRVAARYQATVDRPFVGRTPELDHLSAMVADVRRGRGGVAWVEGDYGIGKSELLVRALGSSHGCQVGWTVTDELTGRTPLRVLLDCLGIESPGQSEESRVLALVDALCARSPVILVADGLQWADDASLVLWHRLAATTATRPLLLLSASRPVPRGETLAKLRRALHDRVLPLGPLAPSEALTLSQNLLGASAGPELQRLIERIPGNPRYLTVLSESLDLRTEYGVRELRDGHTTPKPLLETIRDGFEVLSHQALRWGALLGPEFTLSEIAALTGQPPSELVPVFEEAATVIDTSGSHLTFTHPLFREACYDGIPPATREALIRQLS
ncbi:BTAD domain-containing putative transcriptional regulator [Amycolatopsis sp. NPDC059657]|uniref:BTAD domain-containing putative transcriptional regulator n=1 Tax=Amycolatopsis sp. NPDC059657 TaxID=3346899 RepID=UPI00366B46B9